VPHKSGAVKKAVCPGFALESVSQQSPELFDHEPVTPAPQLGATLGVVHE
jgi:hypothetical protein